MTHQSKARAQAAVSSADRAVTAHPEAAAWELSAFGDRRPDAQRPEPPPCGSSSAPRRFLGLLRCGRLERCRPARHLPQGKFARDAIQLDVRPW